MESSKNQNVLNKKTVYDFVVNTVLADGPAL